MKKLLIILLVLCGCAAPKMSEREGARSYEFAPAQHLNINIYGEVSADTVDALRDALADLPPFQHMGNFNITLVVEKQQDETTTQSAEATSSVDAAVSLTGR